MANPPTLMQQIFSKAMLTCIGTGFASGLPIYVLVQMIPTWMRDSQIDLKTIGLFSLTQLPYVWKFIWAPIFDIQPKFAPKNRRKSWALLCQSALFVACLSMSFLNPTDHLMPIAALSLVISIASASQDAVLDAHRREILTDEEMGLGSSIFVNAYRLSSLIPGSLALYLADLYNWQVAHWSVATALLIIIGFTLWMPEPAVHLEQTKKGLKDIFGKPFKEFLNRNGTRNVVLILSFMLFYKLGDSMATALASPFYLDLGFSKTDLASTVKVASLWSSIAGGIIGGIWMLKMGVKRSLWVFGWFQLLTILGFAALAWDSTILPLHAENPNLSGEQIALQFGLSPNTLLLFIVISAEYLGVGLGTAAFVAFISQHTNKRFSAAQFALLTSISGLPRTLASSQAGWIIEQTGYTHFFLFCTILALPGMGLLLCMTHIKPVTDCEQSKNESPA